MDDALLARPRNPNLDTSELVVTKIPKAWLDMFDAEAHFRGLSDRGPVVREVLQQHVMAQARRWTVYDRVLGGNAVIAELAGMEGNRGSGGVVDAT